MGGCNIEIEDTRRIVRKKVMRGYRILREEKEKCEDKNNARIQDVM
jgi:hypothetical protein